MDRLLAPECISLEPSSLASALDSESAAFTDEGVNGRVPRSVSVSFSTSSLAESGTKEKSVALENTEIHNEGTSINFVLPSFHALC